MHIPVLQKEVLQCLDPKPNENFIDCTVGGGGHSLAISEKILPEGKILGIDWDRESISNLKYSASPKISSPKANKLKLFPAHFWVTPQDKLGIALENIDLYKRSLRRK